MPRFRFNLKRKINEAPKSLQSQTLSSPLRIRLWSEKVWQKSCANVSLCIRLLVSLKCNVIKQIHVDRLNVDSTKEKIFLLNGYWLSPNRNEKKKQQRNATPSSIIRNLVWKFQLIENLFQWIHKSVFIIWIDCMHAYSDHKISNCCCFC